MIKLSIIIPVYNSEPYVDELMRSLMFQVTKEVEVIVVDDGSTFPYVPGHPAVKLFRKENGGVSSSATMSSESMKTMYSPLALLRPKFLADDTPPFSFRKSFTAG